MRVKWPFSAYENSNIRLGLKSKSYHVWDLDFFWMRINSLWLFHTTMRIKGNCVGSPKSISHSKLISGINNSYKQNICCKKLNSINNSFWAWNHLEFKTFLSKKAAEGLGKLPWYTLAHLRLFHVRSILGPMEYGH